MWTKFVLTVLGSHHTSKYSEIYIEEDNNEARKVLRKLYPDIPEKVRCQCCIKMDKVYEDYYYESLDEATKPERGYKFNISNGRYEASENSISLDEYLKNTYILVIRKYDIEQLMNSDSL